MASIIAVSYSKLLGFIIYICKMVYVPHNIIVNAYGMEMDCQTEKSVSVVCNTRPCVACLNVSNVSTWLFTGFIHSYKLKSQSDR
jgi:hypothetical protein